MLCTSLVKYLLLEERHSNEWEPPRGVFAEHSSVAKVGVHGPTAQLASRRRTATCCRRGEGLDVMCTCAPLGHILFSTQKGLAFGEVLGRVITYWQLLLLKKALALASFFYSLSRTIWDATYIPRQRSSRSIRPVRII